MKLLSIFLILLLAVLCIPGLCTAATYYVRADGSVTCANKSTATNPAAANSSLSLAQFNACTFAASDSVLFSSQGGAYGPTAKITLPSSGAGTEITYANVPTETPAISNSGYPALDTNSKNNIIVSGFSLTYTGALNAYPLSIPAGTNVTVSNVTTNTSGLGYGITSSGNLSSVILSGVTITNNGPAYQPIYFYGASNSSITLTNVTANTGTYIDIRNTAGLTVTNLAANALKLTSDTNVTVSGLTCGAGSTVEGLYISAGGTIAVTNFSYAGSYYALYTTGALNGLTVGTNGVTNSGMTVTAGHGTNITAGTNFAFYESSISGVDTTGFSFTGSTGTVSFTDASVTNSPLVTGFRFASTGSGFTCTRCTSSGNNYGFSAESSVSNVIYTNCVADNNLQMGFIQTNTASNITLRYCEASYNGTIDSVTNGGGFLPHLSATGIHIRYCIAHHNYNEGFGDVSTGTNDFYNIVQYANGYAIGDTFKGGTVATPSNRANGYFGKDGGMVTIKNMISGGGKPAELWYDGSYETMDYNLYNPVDAANFDQNGNSWTAYHATHEANSLTGNPLFVNAAIPNFRLLAGSPTINAGVNVGLTSDYEGKPIRGLPDIGAYEWQGRITRLLAVFGGEIR